VEIFIASALFVSHSSNKKKASKATKLHVVFPNQYLYQTIKGHRQQYMQLQNFFEVKMLVLLQNLAQNIYMFANYLMLP